MKDISMDEVNKLIEDVLEHITDEQIYENALSRIDPAFFEYCAKNTPTVRRIGTAFALAGFMEGIKFTLLNLEAQEEE